MNDTRSSMGRAEFIGVAAGALLTAASGRLAPALARPRAASWQEGRKVLFVTVDGFGPDYLQQSDMPNLKRMMAAGAYAEGMSVIPSVTNVNNASVVTGTFPDEHGITGNYYYDRVAGTGTFMESPEFLLRSTMFEEARRRRIRSAFVTSKQKLMFLSRGADFADSAESPTPDLASVIGPAQDVYSADINFWTLRAARHFLGERGCQLVYVATTDYMMHTYPPEDERSQAHLHTLDELLGQIVNDHPNIEVYLTADHSMSAKRDAIDIGRVLEAEGIPGEAVPIIRDRYVAHHSNLGGACYVYLEREADVDSAFALLAEVPGVERIYRKADAAREFQLQPERIGDIFLLGERPVVFGSLPETREEVDIRSHGSLHEQAVPIVCYGRPVDASRYRRNVDLARNFEWEV